MKSDPPARFGLTTRQVAVLLPVHEGVIYTALKRKGQFRGITPIKTEAGRLVWPRAEILKLAPKQLDLAAFLSILTERGLRTNDAAYAIGAALLDPDLPSATEASWGSSVAFDWSVFVRLLVEVYAGHVRRVWPTLNDDDRAQLRSQLLGTDWQEGLVGLVRSLEALAHE